MGYVVPVSGCEWDVAQSFAIGKASQTIAFTPPAAQTFTPAGTVTLTATGGASGLPVTFASTSTSICTTGGSTGTTVTFVNRSPSEVHNVAFGPKKYLLSFSKQTDLLPQGPGSKNQVTPLFLYGTEPKGGYTFDGSNHGNGFLATPLTAGSRLIPLPRAEKVTFSKRVSPA